MRGEEDDSIHVHMQILCDTGIRVFYAYCTA